MPILKCSFISDKAGLLKVSVLLLVCVNLLSLLMFDFGSLRKDSTLTSDKNDLDTQRRIEDIGKTFEFLQKENKINFDSVSKILNKVETIQNVNDLRHQTVVDMISELSSEISIMAYKSDMEKEVSKLHKSIDEMENTYKMSVEQIQATFHNKLEILSDSLSEIETKVTDTRETFDQFKTKAGKEIQSVSASLFNMQITMEHDFKSRLENVKGQLKEIGNAKVKADKILERIQKDVDTMYPNTFDKDKFTLAFMILVAMVMLLAVSVFCLCRRGVSDYSEPSARQMNADPNSVLRQIPSKPLLESGVCIISFDESRTIEYRRQLDSANIPNCRLQEHVIRRHEHIPKLPRCKVYLMCTEFSERNVIIEEPGLGLGDLRRTTYDAVQKLGGCLIILYTRDPGSRRLSGESLYNTNIHCVTHQPELSILYDDGRFLSIYDKLTDPQKTHLRNKIVQNMT